MKKKILVTGGAGYIGSHAAKALFQAGFLPIVYDNLTVGHQEAVRWGPLIIGDLKDKARIRKTLREEKPVAILHFAASALVGESTKNPLKYYDNNVGSSLSLLEAMKEEGSNKPYLFKLLRNVWQSDLFPHERRASAKPHQPLRQVQTDDRADPCRLRQSLWTALYLPSLFQCCRSRS